MMNPYGKLLVGFLAVLTGTLSGCGAEKAQRAKVQSDLRQIGLAFQTFSEANPGKGPAKPEDLKKFIDSPEVYKKLESGEYVFLYGVSLLSMTNGAVGSVNTVLAYEKDVPAKGGVVLMGDANTMQMTADEFKTATKAK